MSIQGRFPANSPSSPQDLKQRVVACLNKLADRDTLALASAELESIARNLTQDSFSSFLNCLYNTDSSCKSPVRKQCVALLSLLSRSHGDSLFPHLSKMVSTVIRRLRDPDSSVRSACAAASADISAHVTRNPYSAVAKPLIDTLVQEGDSNAQIGAAMCLAAAVEAASDPEAEQLRKSLPKMGKLLKSEGFKAKGALLAAIGSVISTGGAGTRVILSWLVPLLTEFLSSDDWAARKSAAEALGRIAMAEEELAPVYKKACMAALESRRFDKVKTVRETMNRALELWKEVPADTDDASSSPSPSISSTDDGNIGCFPSVTRSSSVDINFNTPQPKKVSPIMKRSPSLPLNRSYAATRQKENLPRTIQGNINISKGPRHVSLMQSSDDHSNKNHPGAVELEKGNSEQDIIKHTVSEKNMNEKVHRLGGLRSRSRVVPCNDEDHSDGSVATSANNDVDDNKKDDDDDELSLIREQLAQIENQQSNLLDLLQKFIGSSQNGIQSLESRVSGLETALDEISYDLAVSNGRAPKNTCAGDTCCKLPGSEFLSPKFWKKPEGHLYCSKLSSSSSSTQTQLMNTYETDVQRRSSRSQNRDDAP